MLDIVNIQRGCVYDGPGLRTTVFLKGCKLNCPWCCNPECIPFKDNHYVDMSKCMEEQGIESVFCQNCERKGGKESVSTCIFGVTKKISSKWEPDKLTKALKEDSTLFFLSGGGVTFSGGEPLWSSELLIPVLKDLMASSIHICFETSLIVPNDNIQQVLPYTSLFIVDLKLQKEMNLGEEHIERLKNNLQVIKEKTRIFRLVVTPSILQDFSYLPEYFKYLGVSSIELLRCHNLGQSKYANLGLDFIDFSIGDADLSQFKYYLLSNGVVPTIIDY